MIKPASVFLTALLRLWSFADGPKVQLFFWEVHPRLLDPNDDGFVGLGGEGDVAVLDLLAVGEEVAAAGEIQAAASQDFLRG